MFSAVNEYVLGFLREVLPDIMGKEGSSDAVNSSVGALTKSSTFGEAEVEVRLSARIPSATSLLTCGTGHNSMVTTSG